MTYSLICFWSDFDNYDNFITNKLKNKYKYIDNYHDADIIFVGSFLWNNENDIISLKGIKVLVITEPIEKNGSLVHNLLVNNIFDFVLGSVINDGNQFKYPLYRITFPNHNEIDWKYINIDTDNLENKDFCCLINTHDNWNTRTNIYNKLVNISHIVCPSKLFNNCSNKELNFLGKHKYVKKFLFNICPENFIIDGYITEKLYDCCISGAIPIYAGSFDKYDEMIFNKNRIIFYDPYDDESINNVYNKVLYLLNNKNELKKFYQQDIFCKNSIVNTFLFYENNFNKLMEEIEKLNKNKIFEGFGKKNKINNYHMYVLIFIFFIFLIFFNSSQ